MELKDKMKDWGKRKEENEKNPLHGVERPPPARKPCDARTGGIRYMELKAGARQDRRIGGIKKNPLHGVERASIT